jgi:undecaprenyl-diphosphatase
MNFFEAILMGVIQGLTEFLPVSSSAHIRIAGALLGQDPGAAFTAIIQLGTESAVLLYFRHDIARILSHWFMCLRGKDGKEMSKRLGEDDRDASLGWFIIVGTLPIVIAGVLFQKTIESTLRNLVITVVMLIVFGLLLWYFDAKSKQTKTIKEMTLKDAALFGVGQMLALIPGVSRSGGTITFGRALGYTREDAARISFLMAIPAVFGAGILETVKSLGDVGSASGFPGMGSDHLRHIGELRGRISGNHRVPENRLHLLIQRFRRLPHCHRHRGGSAADYRSSCAPRWFGRISADKALHDGTASRPCEAQMSCERCPSTRRQRSHCINPSIAVFGIVACKAGVRYLHYKDSNWLLIAVKSRPYSAGIAVAYDCS